MKTLKKVAFELVEVDFIPKITEMEFGKLYYSKKYSTTNHLCPCGCGFTTPIPTNKDGWSIDIKNGKVTMTPSILHRSGCKSHYVITNGFANII